MSSLRDIRLLVARKLDEPPSIKSAVLNVLNILDLTLDSEGFQDPPEVIHAIRQLEAAILDVSMDELAIEREDELTDINDLIEDDEDDDGSNDDDDDFDT